MTIYKPNNPERKQEKKPMVASDVVVDDKQKLTDKVDGNDVLLLMHRRPVTNMDVLRRRRRIRCAVIALLMLLVIAMALVVALLFNSRILTAPYIGECEVNYHESMPLRRGERGSGSFHEMFEVDTTYEKLEVPPLLDFRRSIVIHDFKENLSAIIDRENERCYVLPLNRSVIQPPKNFIDLLNKVREGYYVPDAEIIREEYVVLLPSLSHVDNLGYQIWHDCNNFDTYRLVKSSSRPGPRVVSKRSADCRMVGDGFCLGSSLSEKMSCVSFSGCSM